MLEVCGRKNSKCRMGLLASGSRPYYEGAAVPVLDGRGCCRKKEGIERRTGKNAVWVMILSSSVSRRARRGRGGDGHVVRGRIPLPCWGGWHPVRPTTKAAKICHVIALHAQFFFSNPLLSSYPIRYASRFCLPIWTAFYCLTPHKPGKSRTSVYFMARA